jgi:DNA-binding XRE family transcriptional regulator
MNPKAVNILKKLASIYMSTGQFSNAKDIFERIIRQGTVNYETYYELALLCVQTSDVDRAEQILKKYPRTNIIYVTSYSEFALDSYRTNASTFLMKPVGTEKLRDAIQNLRFPVSDINDRKIEQMFQGNISIGQRISSIRKERCISAAQIADEIGCTQQTVYRWERGERIPDVPTLMKIARVLGVNLDDLT